MNKNVDVKWREDGRYYKATVLLTGNSEKEIQKQLASSRIKFPTKPIETTDESDGAMAAFDGEIIKKKFKAIEKAKLEAKNHLLQEIANSFEYPPTKLKKISPNSSPNSVTPTKELEENKSDDVVNQSIAISSTPTSSITTDCSGCEKYEFANKRLQEKIMKHENENLALLGKNMDLQDIVIENVQNLAGYLESINKEGTSTSSSITQVKVGDMKDKQIYIGQSKWIDVTTYNNVCVGSKNNHSQFVTNMAIALFGIETLKDSSVFGRECNRFKNSNLNLTTKPALDPITLFALTEIYKFYLESHLKVDNYTADEEIKNVSVYLRNKIRDLNRPPRPTPKNISSKNEENSNEKQTSKQNENGQAQINAEQRIYEPMVEIGEPKE